MDHMVYLLVYFFIHFKYLWPTPYVMVLMAHACDWCHAHVHVELLSKRVSGRHAQMVGEPFVIWEETRLGSRNWNGADKVLNLYCKHSKMYHIARWDGKEVGQVEFVGAYMFFIRTSGLGLWKLAISQDSGFRNKFIQPYTNKLFMHIMHLYKHKRK